MTKLTMGNIQMGDEVLMRYRGHQGHPVRFVTFSEDGERATFFDLDNRFEFDTYRDHKGHWVVGSSADRFSLERLV